MKAWNHFKTITHHKILVLVGCFKIGLYKQGLLHDLSKYTPTEFLVGCKYYQGYMSPNNAERMDKGYSSAWLHHKGTSMGSSQTMDHSIAKEDDNNGAKNGMTGMKMPIKYVCEMFIDRISASKNYQKEKYTDRSSLEYYEKSKDHYIINEDTAALLEYLLEMLVARGEKETFSFIKNELLKGKVPYEKEELIRRKEALHIPG